MSPSSDYVLISPCRNEADYMRETLDTVVAQTLRPALWVIVDDGSSDATPRILAEYAARHDWIRIVTRKDRGHRAVGPGVIDAFYAGYETIRPQDFAFPAPVTTSRLRIDATHLQNGKVDGYALQLAELELVH